MEFDVESRERLVRVETKLDALIEKLTHVAKNQEQCPARKDYLSQATVDTRKDLKRQRRIALTGWTIAILGGILNFAPKLIELIKDTF